ncbi:MAG TPA: S41 family peptidase [Kiritimatiellia bacterium]|nr:S41 family peptidase [Kiritimatiellia bacterium]
MMMLRRVMLAVFLTAGGVRAEVEAPRTIVATLSEMVELLESRGFPSKVEEASQAAMEAVARTLDPRSRFVTAEEVERERLRRSGTMPHAGVTLSISNGVPFVQRVLAGSSEEEGSQLLPGDWLLAVDGVAVTNRPLPVTRRLLRGSEAGQARVVVSRMDNGTASMLTVAVERVSGEVPAIETAERLPRDLGYILLNGIYPASGMDVVMRLREWTETGAVGLILDLRGAGGGDAASAASIAGVFCPGGTLLGSFRDRQDQDVSVHRSPASNPVKVPGILLVDEETYGQAEILAAVLKDAAPGVLVVGESTSGDLNLREPVQLPGGERLWIATRKLVTATGRTYDGREGVEPDLVAPSVPTAEPFFEPSLEPGRREVLEVERTDTALRRRTRGDAALRLATDILIGLNALDFSSGGGAAGSGM